VQPAGELRVAVSAIQPDAAAVSLAWLIRLSV